jgi:NAD(P)-dependent dehydrogenase (short-subunit alcohol dehydrogenase family)
MTAHRLEGYVSVVAHVGSQLGTGCALRLASEGSDVVAVDHSLEVAERVSATIVERGGTSTPLQADLSSDEGISRFVGQCEDRWGRIDVLLIVISELDWWAGSEVTMELWQDNLRVNLLTPIFLSTRFRPLLAKSSRGSVIFYGSIDGLRGNPRVPAYSVGRGGLVPFTHIMADLCSVEGTRVNYIAGAGIIPMGPEARPPFGPAANAELLLRATPLGRLAEPEDIAGMVAFLASEDSSYVNGSIIVVDGGRTAITPGTSVWS